MRGRRPFSRCYGWLFLAGWLLAAPFPPTLGLSVKNDLAAVLSKASCNAGSCHGNATGKGGGKLSPRGESPILLKATAEIPHEGGKRFSKQSWEYRPLRNWISDGLKSDLDEAPELLLIEVSPSNQILVEPHHLVQLQVTASVEATAIDGTERAVYESSDPRYEISPTGLASFKSPGEPTVVVRYLDRPVPVMLADALTRPDDIADTMVHLLGIDPATHVLGAENRPVPISNGTPI